VLTSQLSIAKAKDQVGQGCVYLPCNIAEPPPSATRPELLRPRARTGRKTPFVMALLYAFDLAGISQPNVLEVITDLDHSLGALLFDRRPNGVEPTMYREVEKSISLISWAHA
jgi:hypothetical protein